MQLTYEAHEKVLNTVRRILNGDCEYDAILQVQEVENYCGMPSLHVLTGNGWYRVELHPIGAD